MKFVDYVAKLNFNPVNSKFVEALEITSRHSQGEGEASSTRLGGFFFLIPQDFLTSRYSLGMMPEPLFELSPGENLEAQKTSENSQNYEIRRSKRRKKSVGAHRENGKTIVVAPYRMPLYILHEYANELVSRLNSHYDRISSNEVLQERAKYLAEKYLDLDVYSHSPVEVTIQWVRNQNSRWGSCTPHEGKIRISHRLQGMPQYVIDAVLLHELIHLVISDHSPLFYYHLEKFPDHKLAKEYLAGYSFAEDNLLKD